MERVQADLALCNESDCAGVLAFPFLRSRLLEAGLNEDKLIDVPPVVDTTMFDDLDPNGNGVINLGAAKPKKNFRDFIRLSVMVPERDFSLYAMSHDWQNYRSINKQLGGRVSVKDPVVHSKMPGVFKDQAWLVYTGSKELASNGWPLSVCEAWASGVGVCLQRVRDDMEDYVGDCAYLFDDIAELPDLIAEPPDEELRKRAHARALDFDVRHHMNRLYGLWANAGVEI